MARTCITTSLPQQDVCSLHDKVFSGGPRVGPVSRPGYEVAADAAGLVCEMRSECRQPRKTGLLDRSNESHIAGSHPALVEFRAWSMGDAKNRRQKSEPPPHQSSRAEATISMGTFGVQPDIDAPEHQRRRGFPNLKPPEELSRSRMAQAAMKFANIDGVPRKRHFEHALADSTCHGALSLARADNDSASTVARHGRMHSARWNECSDSLDCWDAHIGQSPTATRRQFFDQTVQVQRWVDLMDRPLNGAFNTGKHAVATRNRQSQAICDDLRRLMQESQMTAAGPDRSQSAEPAIKCKPEHVPRQIKLWEVLYSAFPQAFDPSPQQNIMPISTSRSSTASGDGNTGEFDISSPEVDSTANSPEVTDSEDNQRATQTVVDPKGHHERLQCCNTDQIASCSQPPHLPLGFRRVLSAVLPTEGDKSLQFPEETLRQLNSLRSTISTDPPRSSARQRQGIIPRGHNAKRRAQK